MEGRARGGPLLLLAGLAACRGAAHEEQTAERARAHALTSGFDAVEAAGAWRRGDRVLYALTTTAGDQTQTKLVEIELLGPRVLLAASGGPDLPVRGTVSGHVGEREFRWTSAILRLAVRVHDEGGALEQETEAQVPETVLRGGIYPAILLGVDLVARGALREGAAPVELSDEELREYAGAIGMLPTLLELLQGDEVLRPLVLRAVGTPPLLSLLTGVRTNVSLGLDRTRVLPDAGPVAATGPVRRLPLVLEVNGLAMLDLELDAVPSDPPLRLGGGIVALRGVGRHDRARTVTLELRAARRGSPAGEFRP